MAIKDLEPPGFTPAMAEFSAMTQGVSLYVQGFGPGEFGIWLRLLSGQQTLIGFGSQAEALAEAESKLTKELASVRAQISRLPKHSEA